MRAITAGDTFPDRSCSSSLARAAAFAAARSWNEKLWLFGFI